MSRYQKGKTNLDFTEAKDSEWQWHQLGHMQVCISLQPDNHTSTPLLSFLQAGCPSCHPTNSVKALKALIHSKINTVSHRAQFSWRTVHWVGCSPVFDIVPASLPVPQLHPYLTASSSSPAAGPLTVHNTLTQSAYQSTDTMVQGCHPVSSWITQSKMNGFCIIFGIRNSKNFILEGYKFVHLICKM